MEDDELRYDDTGRIKGINPEEYDNEGGVDTEQGTVAQAPRSVVGRENGVQSTFENNQNPEEVVGENGTVDTDVVAGQEHAGKGEGIVTDANGDPIVSSETVPGEVKPEADASSTVAGDASVPSASAPGADVSGPSVEEPKMVPTHNLEDRGRADDSVIAGILKKAGIDARDDAKRDRINKIMASVGAGMNMLQAIANIGAASRSNGRFVGNIDVAKGLGEGILADTARRKERDAARQAAIDKRAAMLDAQDAEQRKAEREAAQKALDWQKKLELNNYNNLFKAAEAEKKRKADAEKAEKDRKSKEGIAAANIKAANARNAAKIASSEKMAELKRENDKAIAQLKNSGKGKGNTPKVDSIYLGKNKDGNGEYVNIPTSIASSSATTGRFAQAWKKMKSHPQFEAFMNNHKGDFESVWSGREKKFKFEDIESEIEGEAKPNAKMLTVLNKFLMDHEDDTSPETEAIRELFRQMAAESGGGAASAVSAESSTSSEDAGSEEEGTDLFGEEEDDEDWKK